MLRAQLMSDPLSRPLIITGMHRSGTSLTASFLAALGIHLGERFVPANPTNPLGYFEDVAFVELQARILEAATRDDDRGHRDWGWTESESFDRSHFLDYRPAAQQLLSTRAPGPGLWGWKDPRTSLLLDFWDEILAGQALYVLVYRFPWEVADSIQRLGAGPFLENPEYALQIWSFYNRRLLDFHHRHSDRAILVSSNALQQNPGAFVELLRSKLRLAVGGAAFDSVWRRDLFASFEPDDPLIRLTLATSPQCGRLLEELDDRADLPATGLWHRAPLRGEDLRPPGQVDLSVVIPCYNHGQFLVEAIASVERTATERCELLVVNDGSTQPRTLEVLDILRQAGYYILDQANAGLSAARNSGIRAARGRYVLPLDSDNRLTSGFIASAIRILDAHSEIDVVYGDRLEFGVRSRRVRGPEFDIDILLWWNFIDACAAYRREIWETCGGYDIEMRLFEDWEFWIAAAQRGAQFYQLRDPGFEYRVRPDSMLATADARLLCSTYAHIFHKHRALYEEHLGEPPQAALLPRIRLHLNRASIRMEKLPPEKILKVSLEVSAVPREMQVSTSFWVDARLTNRTDKTIDAAPPHPVYLAYHWIEKTTRQMVVFEGARSGLFPGLEANATGRYLMTIVAPNQPGEYILQTTLVQEGVCWFEHIQPGILQEFAVTVMPQP